MRPDASHRHRNRGASSLHPPARSCQPFWAVRQQGLKHIAFLAGLPNRPKLRQSYLPIVMCSRGQIEGVSAKPTAEQMVPRSCHWTSRDRIFTEFEAYFEDASDFNTLVKASAWYALGALKHNKVIFVPGTLHGIAPYPLSDAAKLGAYVLHGSRALATRAAVLFHWNNTE